MDDKIPMRTITLEIFGETQQAVDSFARTLDAAIGAVPLPDDIAWSMAHKPGLGFPDSAGENP